MKQYDLDCIIFAFCEKDSSEIKFVLKNLNIICCKLNFVLIEVIIQQLICDNCKKVILEKPGESYLYEGQFPISNEEAMALDKEHRGHECHIEVVEKEV
jgi:hypothetical protein